MAQQRGLGYITTGTFTPQQNNYLLPMDESVCGMLFDLSGFSHPFQDYYPIQRYFGKQETQLIHNMEEAASMGIWDNSFMNGLPYYHIKSFYDYVGKDTPLYICFADCSKGFDVMENMQQEANGKMFQIGIWTAQPLWANTESGLIFTNLCLNVESVAETLSGKIGSTTQTFSPISVLLCPNTYFTGVTRSLFDIPNGYVLNMPKLSVCLVQNGSEDIHNMQMKNPNHAPVGCLGFLMACACLAYAEESIGYVDKFNLNKHDTFGNAEVWFGDASIPVGKLQYGKQYAAGRGYILPTEYDGKEAEVFFTGDPTLCKGDYSSFANNRIMHKVRRAVQSALLPYINDNYSVDVANGTLSTTTQTIFTSAIVNMLDAFMVNSEHQAQLSSRAVAFGSSYNILETDEITLYLSVQPVNYSNVINEKDSINF